MRLLVNQLESKKKTLKLYCSSYLFYVKQKHLTLKYSQKAQGTSKQPECNASNFKVVKTQGTKSTVKLNEQAVSSKHEKTSKRIKLASEIKPHQFPISADVPSIKAENCTTNSNNSS